MPGLRQPSVLRAMTRAVADVSAARAALQELGPRPHHELVDSSRAIVAAAEAGDAGVPEADLEACRAVVRLEETHDAYGAPLQEAEGRLEKAYRSAMERTDLEDEAEGGGPALGGGEGGDAAVQEEVVAVLKGLRALDISRSQLEVIPDADAIGGLDHLEELRLSANSLVSLPDSIGLLSNLKILNVENNRLRALLDTISKCRSLEELDASYNNLTYARSPTSVDLEAIVILNIMDAYMRRPELVGTLLGSVLPSGTVHVRSCFVVPHVESTNEVSLKTEFHHSMYALLRTVNPEEAVVGWFSTGFGLSGRSAFIHEFYSREAHNPIHLSFDMEKDFIKAYTSSQVLLRDSDRAAQFQEIPLGVRMIEVKAGVLYC